MLREIAVGVLMLGMVGVVGAQPLVGPYTMFVDLVPQDKPAAVLRWLQESAEASGCQLLTQKGSPLVDVTCANGMGFSARAFHPKHQLLLTCTHLQGGNARDACEAIAALYTSSRTPARP